MTKSLVWFRQDLRTKDNPALFEAAQEGEIIPVYIFDDTNENEWPLGGASKWWLHHSLQSLMESGVPLVIRRGNPKEILEALIQETGATAVHWNRCYEPYAIKRDSDIKESLSVECHSYNGSLLFEPWEVQNKQGGHFKVFTPFWKACLNAGDPRSPLPQQEINYGEVLPEGLELEGLNLLPQKPDWATGFQAEWTPGETGAFQKLDAFLGEAIQSYKKGRDFPALESTSKLSPHLHFGEISPHQIWAAVHRVCGPADENVRHFLSELGWREFSYSLLYHSPTLPKAPFNQKFTNLPWQEDEALLKAWQMGQTGYPLIDAGMRQLWTTGYMHNRVRMIVASFLTKHCLIPWQTGEKWFWDTLVDADLANNAASWQWVAGCGADAAPYFRIFNPLTQSEKFDPKGDYIKKWVPELQNLPLKYIHAPFKAPRDIQTQAGCTIGQDYPEPIVDLSFGRARALEAYGKVKT